MFEKVLNLKIVQETSGDDQYSPVQKLKYCTLINYGDILAEEGKLESSLKAYCSALEIDDNDFSVWNSAYKVS